MPIRIHVPVTNTRANAKVLGTDRVSTGDVDTKMKDKPRSIPFVDVKLLPWEFVKLGNETTLKDIYGKLFRDKNFVTYDHQEYYNCKWGKLGNTALKTAEQNVENVKPAKFYVFPDGTGESNKDSRNASVQLIGNALMLSPTPLRQSTTLTPYTTVVMSKSGNTLWKETPDVNKIVGGNSTFYTNSWTPKGGSETDFEEMGESNEFLPGTRQVHRAIRDSSALWSGITSDFKLKKNQPFCVGVKLFPANPVMSKKQDDFWKQAKPQASHEGAKDNEVGKLYAQDHRNKSAIEIHWGKKGSESDKYPSNALIFMLHQDGKFYMYRGVSKDAPKNFVGDAPPVKKETWSEIGSGTVPTSVMSENVVFLTFIPVGNVLYIYYTDQPTTADTQRGAFSQVIFSGDFFYDEENMEMYSYLGDVNFAFYPIVFPPEGRFVSPVIQTYFPLVTSALLNLSYVGKFGNRCSEKPITFPDAYDKEKPPKFAFLSGTKIDWLVATESPKSSGADPATLSALYYSISLYGDVKEPTVQDGRGASPNSRDTLRWYSPMLFQTQVTLIPGEVLVNYNPNPQIDKADVMNVNLSEGVEGTRCSITLNNRREVIDARKNNKTGGKYTWNENNNFIGVKPIRVNVSYDETKINTSKRFLGYVVNRKYGRASPGNQSTVTLECEDRSKRLRETLAVNLPIYDGWCHLAVMYHLAKEAGFHDDEIMLWQDPQKQEDRVKLSDVMTPKGTAGYFTRKEGCWHGHVEGFPQQEFVRGGTKLPSQYIHMTLPNTTWNESPNYMFQMGTSIWDCMQQVRTHSNWYLYCNNWGSLVYAPPKFLIRETDWSFVEVDKDKKFNEYQRNLNVDYSTADFRNSVMFWGLIPLRGENPDIPVWTPDIIIKKQKGWPFNINDPGFVPWFRWALLRNPKWNDPKRNVSMAEEIFRRVTRQRIAAAFGGWGQEGLFPYDVVKLDESIAKETGIDGEKMIISNVQHTLQAGQMWTAAYTTERYDPAFFEYDPRQI